MNSHNRNNSGHDTTTDEVLDCVRSYAVDPGTAKKLWSISEKMMGQRFEL